MCGGLGFHASGQRGIDGASVYAAAQKKRLFDMRITVKEENLY